MSLLRWGVSLSCALLAHYLLLRVCKGGEVGRPYKLSIPACRPLRRNTNSFPYQDRECETCILAQTCELLCQDPDLIT
eukprot:1159695-Pelagomonas_calceolata.AAC.7